MTTGLWSQQAIKEAGKVSRANEVWDQGTTPLFNTIPDVKNWKIDREDSAYFHYCDNETVHGVEFKQFPFDDVL